MKKNIARLFVSLLVVMFTLGAVGPAFASPNDPPDQDIANKYPNCQASASTLTGPAPLKVQFVATSPNPNVAINWGFDDGLGGTGAVIEHEFPSEGEYKVRGWAVGNGFFGACNLLIINVTHATDDPDQKSDDDQGDGGDDQQSNSGATTNQNGLGLTAGDNSPVVNGNGNLVLVVPQKEEKPVAQPLDITVNIQPAPITTQKTNIITAIIHAVLKATETFFHVLGESWFVPVLVK